MNKLLFLLYFLLPLTVHGCVRTLLANDARLSRLSLPEGLPSVTWDNWLTEEKDVDLVWGDSSRSYLTIAPKGNRMGAMVDLGTEQQLQTRYHIDNTDLLPGSIFLSIHMDKEEHFKLLKDYQDETFQEFDKRSLAGLQIPTKGAVINPVLNHVYLINITDTSDVKFCRIIKLKILSNPDRNTLVIRYNVLWDTEYGKDSTCFATSDEPDDNDDGHSHNHYTFKRAPRWVKASIISLFAMLGLIIVVIISLIYAVHRKRVEEYERI